MVYTSQGNPETVEEISHESPFAAIEKKLKMNLKDDLLPLLGSEIAVRLPATGLALVGVVIQRWLPVRSSQRSRGKSRSADFFERQGSGARSHAEDS